VASSLRRAIERPLYEIPARSCVTSHNLLCTRELAAKQRAHPAYTAERFFSFMPFGRGGTLPFAFYEEEARAPTCTASPKHSNLACLVSPCMYLMNETDSIRTHQSRSLSSTSMLIASSKLQLEVKVVVVYQRAYVL
jgi:hypothetical protein